MKRHLLIGAMAATLLGGTAYADTLREALNSTYHYNPTLNAQRESLKSSDAGVAIAKAAGRPTVSGTVGLTRDVTRGGRFDSNLGKGPNLTTGVDIAYPLFQGGTVSNNIKAAKKRNEAGRETLRAVEGDTFVEAVSAYMDVMTELAKTFEPGPIEARWYDHWEGSGQFRPERKEAVPFTIVMPPPNVTGSLHIGHALDNTLQDILTRHARMQGKDALWVVGTDHAAAVGAGDRDALILETLLAFKRAGATGVLTYHALDAARLING